MPGEPGSIISRLIVDTLYAEFIGIFFSVDNSWPYRKAVP